MNKIDNLQVVWFKRDLRIFDQECLHKAASKGPVLALYDFEPGMWEQSDTSYRQFMFLSDCVNELEEKISNLGGKLNIYQMDFVKLLSHIYEKYGHFTLWSHQETGNQWSFNRDSKVRNWCKDKNIKFNEPLQFGVWRGSFINRNTWSRDWDKMMSKNTFPTPLKIEFVNDSLLNIPKAEELNIKHDGIQNRQLGGRAEGLRILNGFLYERGENYRTDMSSPITGSSGCSRLSPYIAFGCVSMREVYQATLKRQEELRLIDSGERGQWLKSMQSFIGRLHWHCHFMQKLELEPEIEYLPMCRVYENIHPLHGINDKLDAFENGETGYPFVDACMRYLKYNGWINFRMRAMLMSFASYNLFVPWQKSGAILARFFTDYEAGIHWSQSQMQSGVTGINTIRIYSPIKQGLDQDPDGVFTREWVPELKNVPDKYLQTPWEWDGDYNYTPCIVDYKSSVKYSRDKLWAIRKTEEAKAEAKLVYEKHGSRKKTSRNFKTSKIIQ